MFLSLTRHLALMAQQQARYDALLEHYHALKASGASAPPPPASPLEKRPTDRVSEVIADVAGSNATLRRQLGAFARQARAAQKDEQEIVDALLHWPSDDDGTL